MSIESDNTVCNKKKDNTVPLFEFLPARPRPRSGAITKEVREKFLRECYKDIQDFIDLSPYDVVLPPPGFGGGFPIFPLDITESNRPLLQNFSQLALEYYNDNNKEEGSGPSYEFDELVKCTHWYYASCNAYAPRPDPYPPSEYYITFQAKPKGAITTTVFQAKVLVDKFDKDKPPVIEECHIQI